MRHLELFSPEFREPQIEVHHTGELVAVDTFFAGTLKDVGKVYQLMHGISPNRATRLGGPRPLRRDAPFGLNSTACALSCAANLETGMLGLILLLSRDLVTLDLEAFTMHPLASTA